jgi:RNA polymerase sigma factor (sigma-70 family)
MQPNQFKPHLIYRREGDAELDIIQRLLVKDETALICLMNQYGDYLLRTAFLLVKDRQTAEEVVQDTFIHAYSKIDQLKDASKLKSWLTRITINRCRMKQRTWTWKNLFPIANVEPLMDEQLEIGLEEQLITKWNHEQLIQAIHQLPYKYREVITLYYFNEMSIQEITEHLGSNDNTIKSQLSRGRMQLKAQLSKEGAWHESGAETYNTTT